MRIVVAASLVMLATASIAGCGGAGHPATTADAPDVAGWTADFDEMWQFVHDQYGFFAEKQTDWDQVRELYRPRALTVKTERELIRVLEDALDELYNPHSHLGANTRTSWRLVPHELYAEWRAGKAIITAVRGGSAAAAAGVHAGMEVIAVDGVDVEAATRARLPRTLRGEDPAALEWALLSVLAGSHDHTPILRVRTATGGVSRPPCATTGEPAVCDGVGGEVELAPGAATAAEPGPVFAHRVLDGNVGYVRIASFAFEERIADFDRALDELRGTAALIIDVRANDGGDTAVAVPIMGRLITTAGQYAWMARRDGAGLGARWAERVEPRGPWTYQAPVVVLVDRFSVSMAEGFAMGLDGLGRATIVGTRMAGLGAATARIELAHTGLPVQISAEPVYQVNGASRSDLRPRVEVDLAASTAADPILDEGLRVARELSQASPVVP